MNRNGVIEYEEFAAAKLLVNRDKNTTEDIDEEFNWLQGASSEQKIRWNDFVNEYGRLLDGVPRPVEEKAEIIKTKVTRLQAALKLAEETLRATPLLSKMRMKEFIEVLQQAHGSSLEEAFDVLDLHDRGFVTMADLTSALERLLKVNRETHKGAIILLARSLFQEFDVKNTGRLTLEKMLAADKRRQIKERAAILARLERQGTGKHTSVTTEFMTVEEAARFVQTLLQDNGQDQSPDDMEELDPLSPSTPSAIQRATTESRSRSHQTTARMSWTPQKGNSSEVSEETKVRKLPRLSTLSGGGAPSSRAATAVSLPPPPSPSAAASPRYSTGAATPRLATLARGGSQEKRRSIRDSLTKRKTLTDFGDLSRLETQRAAWKPMTCIAFEHVLTRKLKQVHGFNENLREHGVKVATRFALGGWSAQEVWSILAAEMNKT
eukprot:TRINITY_DN23745_c0_g1_i4.p1 TRINITY_DN23745_c0_g1~~TRINITY_DN23745_c0_g1_i4.p1  ORF type:complete len:437 (-),score=93.68 TRINITY_DN23745_c0_g1_i4:163-1473(-)